MKLKTLLLIAMGCLAVETYGQTVEEQLAHNAHQTKLNYQTFDLKYDFVDLKEFDADPIEYGTEAWVAFYFTPDGNAALMTQYFPDEKLIRVTLKKKPGLKMAYSLRNFTRRDIGRD